MPSKRMPSMPPRIGAWTINERIGSGQFGHVYLASKTTIDGLTEKVAIKQAQNPQSEPAGAGLIRHEHSVLKSIDNPHVARVVDSGYEDGYEQPFFWIATELVSGDNLENEVQRYGPLSKQQWLELAFDMFSGLAAAHEVGVVHCDLRPANIMRDSRRSVIVDFGLSSFVNVLDAGDEIGQLPRLYSAPERIDGSENPEDREYPVDLFSAGVTLAFAGSGYTPWETRQSNAEQLAEFANTRPRLDGLDAEMSAIVRQLLSLEPHRRGSAGEMLAKVRALLPADSARLSEKNDYVHRRTVNPGDLKGRKGTQNPSGQTRIQEPRSFERAFFLATRFGFVGADRFYLGKKKSGIAKIIIYFGGLGIWSYLDALRIASGKEIDVDGQPLTGIPSDLSRFKEENKKWLVFSAFSSLGFYLALFVASGMTSTLAISTNP